MKVILKPIEVVTWTDEKGNINPVRFRYQEKDESYKVIKIERIVHTEMEKLCGNLMMIYRCSTTITGQQRMFEIKYELATCKWMLFKI